MTNQTVLEVPRQLRSDRGLPVVGRFFDYTRDPLGFFRHQWETYGPVSPFASPLDKAVVLLGPDACEQALRNKDKAFVNEPAWGRIVGPFFHRGLMLLDFDEHHAHRRIMQEAFTRDRLAGTPGGCTPRSPPARPAGTPIRGSGPTRPSSS